jgi:hypothetical protein
MEAAKRKFNIEVYFYVTVGIIVTAASIIYLSRSQQVSISPTFCVQLLRS